MISAQRLALSLVITTILSCALFYVSCKKEKKDPCAGVTCLNGGTCSEGVCLCTENFAGAYCQTRVQCEIGYWGVNCQIPSIIGTWNGRDACSPNGNYDIIMVVSRSPTDSTIMLINNPGGFGTNNTIQGTLSADWKTITYTNQVVNPAFTHTDTLSGTITLSDNSHFTHTYTAREGVVFSCSGSYQKQ